MVVHIEWWGGWEPRGGGSTFMKVIELFTEYIY